MPMPITNDLRKTLTDNTPFYFAAGTADLAVEKLRTVPTLLDKLRAQAPERFAAVRSNTDLAKVREQAQHYALQGVGVAAQYAVKARETYDELADRGRGAVEHWRGAEEETAKRPEVATGAEREPVEPVEPVEVSESREEQMQQARTGSKAAQPKSAAKKTTARKSAASKKSGSSSES